MKKKCVQGGSKDKTNENFPDMSGGGGMGCRLPPADTTETEERDEDSVIHNPLDWSNARGQDYDVTKNKELPVSSVGKKPQETVEESFDIKINDSKVFYK